VHRVDFVTGQLDPPQIFGILGLIASLLVIRWIVKGPKK
jgi:hypothetical protein